MIKLKKKISLVFFFFSKALLSIFILKPKPKNGFHCSQILHWSLQSSLAKPHFTVQAKPQTTIQNPKRFRVFTRKFSPKLIEVSISWERKRERGVDIKGRGERKDMMYGRRRRERGDNSGERVRDKENKKMMKKWA